jgi:hypothetical protein
MQVLQEELTTYERHRKELLQTALGKWALIHKDKVLGTFDTRSDAVVQGYQQLGNVPMLVKEVVIVEKPLQFGGGLMNIRPLSAEYEHVHQRLFAFDNVPEPQKQQAWDRLLEWDHLVRIRSEHDLPAPWIFANESGTIEFEWEMPSRSLMLRLTSNGVFEYLKTQQLEGDDVTEEGIVSSAVVDDLLLWVCGA